MNISTVTVKETRDNLAEILDRVYAGNATYIVTKFGKPRAKITPITTKLRTDTKIKKEQDPRVIHSNNLIRDISSLSYNSKRKTTSQQLKDATDTSAGLALE